MNDAQPGSDAQPGDWAGGTPTPMPREPRAAPAERLAVTLTREQWGAVLGVMNESPVANRIVAPLLIAITGQLQWP